MAEWMALAIGKIRHMNVRTSENWTEKKVKAQLLSVLPLSRQSSFKEQLG